MTHFDEWIGRIELEIGTELEINDAWRAWVPYYEAALSSSEAVEQKRIDEQVCPR